MAGIYNISCDSDAPCYEILLDLTKDGLIMNPTLVYLHIPKSAGTTYREYLINIYGKENVFWYGLDSDPKTFDPEEVASVSVVGGHKKLSFFPRTFDALYASVIRDPLERAVSHFNYCTAPYAGKGAKWPEEHLRTQEIWREKGMLPSSLLRSIENCEDFRHQVSNYQCDYLSRYGASFQGVRRTLEEESMVIGVFDQLPRFNAFLRSNLKFEIENKIRVNFSSEGYHTPILAEPGVVELVRSINAEDQALYNYVSSECGGLYARAKNLNAIIERVPDRFIGTNLQRFAGHFDWTNVHLFSKGIVGIAPNTIAKIPLTLLNGSASNIVFGETTYRSCAIGWQFLNESGEDIEGAEGICKFDMIFPWGGSKMFLVEIIVDEAILRNENPRIIQFFIIDSDDQVRKKYPMNSAWARLHAQ